MYTWTIISGTDENLLKERKEFITDVTRYNLNSSAN
jgi:hypothetical protein